VADETDNCPSLPNEDQLNTEGALDGGDACDNCPVNSNPTQRDADNDGIGNACDGDWVSPGC